jgi:SNF2 family DNA or RNA helicase
MWMLDVSSLPPALEALRQQMPEGYELSERLLDPVVVIARENTRITARLAGIRTISGEKRILPAASNRHEWVLDGTTIRPLPRDSAAELSMLLAGYDPEDLSYSHAMQLAHASRPTISVEMAESLVESGQMSVDQYTPDIVVPGLQATLFPYQARGVGWMQDTLARTGGMILADEMGLGKTLQIIALLVGSPPPPEAPALVVCPTSLIANWVREVDRFAPSLTIAVHRGPYRAGIHRDLQKSNIVITTYDTMVNDISIFSSFEWSWLICDEAQALKNPDSARRQAISTIPRRRTIPMTGTPVENSLLDLWSLVDLAIPGLLGTRSDFESSYPDSTDSAQALALLTDPIILRRKVADVASDLPERIDIDVPLELDESLAQHYRDVRKTTLARYPTAGALVATLQLQLVCAHPWLRRPEGNVPEDDASVIKSIVYPLATPKMERLAYLLREAFMNEQKVIVFSLFNRVGELIQEAVPSTIRTYWGAINGSTLQEERQPLVDAFSAHDGPACLILNPKAAGAGLNITAATVVIHFTPVWNPAIEAQASARAHRLGQTRPVTVYRLFYKDTVEEVMIERSRWKAELANESVPVSTRDADDLQRALDIEPALA